MKRGIVLAVMVVFASGVASWAQTNTFKISIKGTITQDDGTKTQVKDIAKGVSALLSDTNNILVAVYSADDNLLTIDEVDPTNFSDVRVIASTFALAVLNSGKFNGDLEAGDVEVAFQPGIPVLNGDVQADGKAVVKNGQVTGIGAKLTGAWASPTLSSQPAAVFKGTLKSSSVTNAAPANWPNF